MAINKTGRFSTVLFNVYYRIKAAFLRPFAEMFGLTWFSRMEIMGLDKLIDEHFNFENGVFLEAGAWDGVLFSNTYFLEKFRHWHGVLVEPIPEYAALCNKNRKRSTVFSCALVGKNFRRSSISISQAGLGSVVSGAMDDVSKKVHIEKIRSVSPWTVRGERTVPAMTLNDIIRQSGISKIDFLSLDVEGYEYEALTGLDFSRYKPRFLLFEAQTKDKFVQVATLLKRYYSTIQKINSIDYLCFD